MQSKLELTLPPVPESLIAVIPRWTERYRAKEKRSKLAPWIVHPGVLQPQPRYLPATWSTHIQPEGQLYFASTVAPRTITDADFYDAVLQEKVLRLAQLAVKVAEARNIKLPETSELYLEPHSSNDSCYYYFVDHATQCVFWLDEHKSEDFYFEKVVSDTQSVYMLEEQYWAHIEQFPSHRQNEVSLRLEELIPVFQHGECDHRTSSSSTFPYDAKDCKELLRLLYYAKENPYSPFNVCFVARLWAEISGHRHHTFYGQQLARLDRTVSVVDQPKKKRGHLFAAVSHVLLGSPERFGSELEKMYTDDIAYGPVWRDFLSETQDEWRQSLTLSLGLSIFNAILLLVPEASRPLAVAALLCCAVVAVASPLLQARPAHRPMNSGEKAATYLDASSQDCHRVAALTFALPHSFFLWATGLTVAQAVVWFERTVSEHVPLEREVTMCILAAIALSIILAACVPWRRWGAAVARATHLPWWRKGRSGVEHASSEFCEKV